MRLGPPHMYDSLPEHTMLQSLSGINLAPAASTFATSPQTRYRISWKKGCAARQGTYSIVHRTPFHRHRIQIWSIVKDSSLRCCCARIPAGKGMSWLLHHHCSHFVRNAGTKKHRARVKVSLESVRFHLQEASRVVPTTR